MSTHSEKINWELHDKIFLYMVRFSALRDTLDPGKVYVDKVYELIEQEVEKASLKLAFKVFVFRKF